MGQSGQEAEEARQIQNSLVKWGSLRLLSGLAFLAPVVLYSQWRGVALAPALLVGGVIGLGWALLPPGQLIWLWNSDAADRGVWADQRRIVAVIRQRRHLGLMVLATLPFFLVVSGWLWLADPPPVPPGWAEWVLGIPVAVAQVNGVAAGVQYLQVWHSLRAERI